MSSTTLRDVMHAVPQAVAVVTVSSPQARLGLTVSSFIAISVDPPLIGFSLARTAALHELLRDEERFAVSFLADGQDAVAEHFARGVPPIVHWQGIALDPDAGDPPVIAGAIGSVTATIESRITLESHTLVIGRVTEARPGRAAPGLLRVRGRWGASGGQLTS